MRLTPNRFALALALLAVRGSGPAARVAAGAGQAAGQSAPPRPRCSANSATGAPTRRRPAARRSASRWRSRPRRWTTRRTAAPRPTRSIMFISTRPAEKVSNEISVLVTAIRSSRTPRPPSPSAARTSRMYTQNDGAWVKNAAEEAKLIDAMRKGADVVIKATTSARHPDHRHVLAQGHCRRRSIGPRRSASESVCPHGGIRAWRAALQRAH